MTAPALNHGFGCTCYPSMAYTPVSRRRFLAGAGAVAAASLLPGRTARAQGSRVIDTHHHFYPPSYQKAWMDWEDARKIPHFATQVGWSVDKAVEDLQIDARAGAEVRRLSGGNQQKVTIARWVAAGVQTMLCFDPTRGIDIRTKNQIYALLRDLSAAGAAILFYTSDLKEIQLVCDRVVVVFGGQVVAELPAAVADEVALLRAAHNIGSDGASPAHPIDGAPPAPLVPSSDEQPAVSQP